ncbi:MAG TPA: cytochrome c oxidase assembly protein [Devosiaceae bacterium]
MSSVRIFPDELAASAPGSGRRDALAYAGLALLGVLVWWGDRFHAAGLPVWAPWEFSPLWFGAATLSLYWYGRGLLRMPAGERPAFWRQAVFLIGVGALYTVLQTRFEYLAEHMFFINRIQHIVMHHLGPFLVALSCPGPVLAKGLPQPILSIARARPVRVVMAVIQQPFIAALLFVGLVALWLVPAIHFRAMLDPVLYNVMNWSMVVDGLLFWAMVLDPRGRPLARASFATRAMVAVGVMMPQIALGAIITFAGRDLYAFYSWCGRIYPSIGPYDDQQYGGLIIWIPAAMMSVIALLVVLDNMRRFDESQLKEQDDNADHEHVISSSAWTGR